MMQAERELLHTRSIEANGYRRCDGLWDIEGTLKDIKTYSFQNIDRSQILPGEPLHQMMIRITLDDKLFITDIYVEMPATPYNICPNVIPNFDALIGLQITYGFHKKILASVGGVKGCRHLLDLLKTITTTAIQTILPILARENSDISQKKSQSLKNTCYAYAEKSDVYKRLK